MPRLQIDLDISADEFRLHYGHPGVLVYARAVDGRSVCFPARLLQPFVTHGGVRGRFRIEYGADGRCREISRLDP